MSTTTGLSVKWENTGNFSEDSLENGIGNEKRSDRYRPLAT